MPDELETVGLDELVRRGEERAKADLLRPTTIALYERRFEEVWSPICDALGEAPLFASADALAVVVQRAKAGELRTTTRGSGHPAHQPWTRSSRLCGSSANGKAGMPLSTIPWST